MLALDPAFLKTPIAHRALHDASKGIFENCRSAIIAAIEHEYAIEIDLQLSADGCAMVFHDDTLDRLTDKRGDVSDYTAAELSQIKVGSGQDVIEPLEDILHLIDGRVPLLIELKDQSRQLSQTDGRLEQATIDVLSLYHGPVAVMSFNPYMIATMAQLSSELPLGLTTGGFMDPSWGVDAERVAHLSQIADFDPTRYSFVSHFALELTAPCIQTLKEQGAAIFTWTIRSSEAEAIARQTVDNITFEGYLAAHP
ncbi:glycerophosphoryl diester phosphodiesterase [Rhodobacteraceae bacterium HIMB11]|nr:glycerophosphoryl diester phosphodiesterase [Rhodobacteraceae bacterium HIMB11]